MQLSQRWNYHDAVGALDGKHVAMRCPKRSGSWYYKYKGFYSVVKLAPVDADNNFLWVSVGSNGSCSDAQIFNECQLKDNINNGSIRFPDTDELPGNDRNTLYFIVAVDAFALGTWLIKLWSRSRTQIFTVEEIRCILKIITFTELCLNILYVIYI